VRTDPDFAAKRALYRTARIVDSDHYVALDRFIPASAKYCHAEFWQVTCAQGKQFQVYERELTDFCL
jgi:hypothetical protein